MLNIDKVERVKVSNICHYELNSSGLDQSIIISKIFTIDNDTIMFHCTS